MDVSDENWIPPKAVLDAISEPRTEQVQVEETPDSKMIFGRPLKKMVAVAGLAGFSWWLLGAGGSSEEETESDGLDGVRRMEAVIEGIEAEAKRPDGAMAWMWPEEKNGVSVRRGKPLPQSAVYGVLGRGSLFGRQRRATRQEPVFEEVDESSDDERDEDE